MLDTNTVSYILKGRSQAARDRLAGLKASDIACISVITEAELLYGIAMSGAHDQRKRLLEWFLLRLDVRTWGREEAAVYGQLRVQQESAGQALGPLDTQIAAHAIAIGAVSSYE